jgi:hypothetical protein
VSELPETVPSILDYLEKLATALFPGATLGPPTPADRNGRFYVTFLYAGKTPALAAMLMQDRLNKLKQQGCADVVFRLKPWFQLEKHRYQEWHCRTRLSATPTPEP